ncbi:MAG: hypothetical protein NVS3B20_16810 [Polyangiales bacterium]
MGRCGSKAMKTILLVDDNKGFLGIYQARLLADGYRVLTAADGFGAMKVLGQEVLDLVLLDLIMPGMDGFKVLQSIRTNPKLKSLPVIVFSARGEASEIEKAIGLGATAFLVKTTTRPNDLAKHVSSFLRDRAEPASGAMPAAGPPQSARFHAAAQATSAIPRYLVRFVPTQHDAARLAAEFDLSPSLTCNRCKNPLVMHLEHTGAPREPLFAGVICCATCPRS